MKLSVKVLSLVSTLSLGLGSSLSAAVESTDAASIPEPSVALLGGLCGIFFLLWRKK
jgi:ABC-type multidrug transport system permease subunit